MTCSHYAHRGLVRWLGIIWMGTPWPLRLRLRWPGIKRTAVEIGRRSERLVTVQGPIHKAPMPGCGCIALLKDIASLLPVLVRVTRKNRQARIIAWRKQDRARAYWVAHRRQYVARMPSPGPER